MGSQPTGEYSRPPRLEDLVLLCRSLNAENARYVVVGGFAVILHGYIRGTMDVDLLIEPSVENVRAVKRALAKLPDNAGADVADTDVQQYQVVRVGDEFVVDLMAKACGITYSDAVQKSVRREVDGVTIPFADVETLILTKDTVRPKDQQDVLFLKRKLGR